MINSGHIDLSKYRKEFPFTKEIVFLNHASFGPLPEKSWRATEEYYKYLRLKNINAGSHYTPSFLYKPYDMFYKKDCPIVEDIYQKLISLPVHTLLTKKDIIKICNTINDFYKLGIYDKS